jgi:hypothetical protein
MAGLRNEKQASEQVQPRVRRPGQFLELERADNLGSRRASRLATIARENGNRMSQSVYGRRGLIESRKRGEWERANERPGACARARQALR